MEIIAGIIIIFTGWKMLKYFGGLGSISQRFKSGDFNAPSEMPHVPNFLLKRPELVAVLGNIAPFVILFGIFVLLDGLT